MEKVKGNTWLDNYANKFSRLVGETTKPGSNRKIYKIKKEKVTR